MARAAESPGSPERSSSWERPTWAPPGVNLDRPSVARVYDYFLGGFHNFAADREVGEQTRRLLPEVSTIVLANRAFLTRAVRYCVAAGVTQFLDIGSGIPTVGNVHETAQEADPQARVVYVDVDPVAVVHSRAILADNKQATAIQADLREPESILRHPELQELLDLSQPVAVLMVAVLHFVANAEDPAGIIDQYWKDMAPDSHLVISHAAEPQVPTSRTAEAQELYSRAVAQYVYRTQDEVRKLFDRFELVDPGVVPMDEWRPDPTEWQPDVTIRTAAAWANVAVGRKP